MNKRTAIGLGVGALAAMLAFGSAAAADKKKKPAKDYRAATMEVMKSSFQAKGQATLERLLQDEVQVACSQHAAGQTMNSEAIAKLAASQLAAVKYPADGKYLGSWEKGEKLAQSGVGFQFTEDPAKPAGGNCYACHQLTAEELSFGTLGPSLRQYGKLRGNSEPILKYTWAKIWNAQSFNACSNMPRFGHKGILTEAQIKDIMALLFDPESPVNK